MSNYLPLDEAAKILGVSPEELVEMRSRGEIFGYRDGASWKFKPEEIERVQDEMRGGEGSSAGSDVALIADPSSDSGVRLVTRSSDRAGESSALNLTGDSDGDLQLGDESAMSGSAIDIGNDLKVTAESGSEISLSDVIGSGVGMSPINRSDIHTGSDEKIANAKPGSSGSLDLDGDLQLADDASDDLVLGSGSDLALATDSGINLMSPSDSGLSLEDEPLDLAGTGISGLDLAGEGTEEAGSAAGSGSLVDFQQDEEFQLSPSGGMEEEEDSGSQVIELEDSTDFGSAPVALPGDLGGFGDDAAMAAGGALASDDGLGLDSMGGSAGAAVRAVPDVHFDTWQVACLMLTLLLFGLSGIFVTDIVRNMWAWNSNTDLTSGVTQMVLDAVGMK